MNYSWGMHDESRVIFPNDKQRIFIEGIISSMNCSLGQLADMLGISSRNLRDWRREKLTIPMWAVNRMCELTDKPLPNDTFHLKQYWSTNKAACIGGRKIMERYGHVGGDTGSRLRAWQSWWRREGRNQTNTITASLPVAIPTYSDPLAEWVGIMLGDGGITHYQLVITLNRIDDAPYAAFVSGLIEQLFELTPSCRPNPHDLGMRITVSRRKLVKHAIENLGLVLGNKVKQQVSVPKWIQQDRGHAIACLRGLIDTDGSVFRHAYSVKGKQYSYVKMSFANRSIPLLQYVTQTLEDMGFSPRMTAGVDVRLESKIDVKRYFELIGSHNPKHLKKYPF